MLKKIEALLTLSITVLLSIIIGFAAGLLAAALYFIPNYQNKLTLSDIGGMLAGFGTIGLVIIAIRTINSWKKQNNHNYQLEYLRELSHKLIQYTDHVEQIISALERPFRNDGGDKSPAKADWLDGHLRSAGAARKSLLESTFYFNAILKEDAPESMMIEEDILQSIDVIIEQSLLDEKAHIKNLRNKFDDEIAKAKNDLNGLYRNIVYI